MSFSLRWVVLPEIFFASFFFSFNRIQNWKNITIFITAHLETLRNCAKSLQGPLPLEITNILASNDSDCDVDHHVDLNIPSPIVDLTEGSSSPVVKPNDKSKGKRKCDVDLQSSHSSKRSTKGEEVYTRITREFDSMANTVIWHLELSNNSPSVGDASSTWHLPYQGSTAHLMQIINSIVEEMSMPLAAYVEMCKTVVTQIFN